MFGEHAKTASAVLHKAWSDGKRVWWPLLVTDFTYKLLALVVLAPVVGLALRVGLALSGRTVVADQDILFFLLSPIGLVVSVVIGALSLTLLALEQACLMTIGMAAVERENTTVVDVLIGVLRRGGSVIRLAVQLVVKALLYAAPFLVGIGLIYLLLLRDYDINFYLTDKPPAFLAAVGLALVLIAGLAWVLVPRLIGWSLALPLVLFERVRSAEALNESTRRASGDRPPIAWALILWGAGSFLLSLVLPGLVFALGRGVAPETAGNLGLLLPMMLLITVLWLVANGIVSWLTASAFAVVTVRLYLRFGREGSTGEALNELTHPDPLPGRTARLVTLPRLALGLLVLALAATGVGWYLLNGVRGHDDTAIIAHRGAAGVAPENTLASILSALDQGTDFVEIDVQETVDDVVVVIHDSDLMKVAGTDLKIWDATTEQLAQIDIGSWFGGEFSDQRVPTLRQVLEAARGRARVTIELKYYGHDEQLEQRVIDLVEELGMSDQVVVMSLKYDAVQKMRSLRPDWTVGLLTATAVGDLTRLDADFLAVNSSLATRGFVRRAQDRGKDVWVWTVNDPVQMFRMMNLGVDGIITDQPGLAREVLERRRGLNSLERLLIGLAYHFGASAPDPPPETDL